MSLCNCCRRRQASRRLRPLEVGAALDAALLQLTVDFSYLPWGRYFYFAHALC